MAQITISMPNNLEREIRAEVENGGFATVSAYITEVLRSHLMSEKPLDYWTRVSLAMQLENNRLLSTLTKGKQIIPENEWNYSRIMGVLEDGIAYEYDDIFLNVDRHELTRGDAKFVIYVLAMYEDMQWSVEKLGLDDLKDRVAFPGFDANHAGSLLGYVRHLVKNQRFAHLSYRDKSFNSHGLNPSYGRMLDRYNEIKAKQEKSSMEWVPLTKEELGSILGLS